MADHYDYLMSLLGEISRECKVTIERGVDCFELEKIEFNIDGKDFATHKKADNSWLRNYRPRIIYEPFRCFLAYLQKEEQCGWRVKIWGGCYDRVTVWLTILPIRPEITEVSYANEWGEKISTLRYWFDRGGY